MIFTVLAVGLGGLLLLIAFLRAIRNGFNAKPPLMWIGSVGAPALLFSLCAIAIVAFFYDSTPHRLILIFWLIFILALEPAYRVIKRTVDQPL